MKSSFFICVALLFLAQPLFAAKPGQPFLLLYSNDVHGETAPCG